MTLPLTEQVAHSPSEVVYTLTGDLKPVVDRMRELVERYHPAGYGTLAYLGAAPFEAVALGRWRAVVKRAASCD
jgi:hypothetical protein